MVSISSKIRIVADNFCGDITDNEFNPVHADYNENMHWTFPHNPEGIDITDTSVLDAVSSGDGAGGPATHNIIEHSQPGWQPKKIVLQGKWESTSVETDWDNLMRICNYHEIKRLYIYGDTLNTARFVYVRLVGATKTITKQLPVDEINYTLEFIAFDPCFYSDQVHTDAGSPHTIANQNNQVAVIAVNGLLGTADSFINVTIVPTNVGDSVEQFDLCDEDVATPPGGAIVNTEIAWGSIGSIESKGDINAVGYSMETGEEIVNGETSVIAPWGYNPRYDLINDTTQTWWAVPTPTNMWIYAGGKVYPSVMRKVNAGGPDNVWSWWTLDGVTMQDINIDYFPVLKIENDLKRGPGNQSISYRLRGNIVAVNVTFSWRRRYW